MAADKITVTDDAKRKVEMPAKPQRIVVLNSSNLELLYAVGGQAIGRPESTGMPEYLATKVKHLPSVGETPNPNIEKIVSLAPDLVIGVNVMFHHAIIPPLEKAKIPVLLLSINSYKDILDNLASFLAASAVSVAGLLGFVGLITPHAVRLLVGSDHKFLLPFSIIFGAALIIFADTAARTVLSPVEIPVGVLMAFLGAPFFLYLLRGRLKG